MRVTSNGKMSDEEYVYEESDEKRAHHNALEKKRRNYIRTSFEGLRAQMFSGKLGRGNSKSSRAIVLQAAKKLINRSRELSRPIPREAKKAVVTNSTKFYKKLTMLAEKIKRYNTPGAHNQEEMLKDYLTMRHMLKLMNDVPDNFLELFAVEGINKKPHIKREIQDDSDAEQEEMLYQAQVGDLNLANVEDDDGKAVKPYFRNNPSAFGLIFGHDDRKGHGPDSDSDYEPSGTEFVPRRSRVTQVEANDEDGPRSVSRTAVSQVPQSPAYSEDSSSCSSMSPSPMDPPSTPESNDMSTNDKIFFTGFDDQYANDLGLGCGSDFTNSVPNSIFDDDDSLDLDSLLQCDQMNAMWPNLAEESMGDIVDSVANDLLSLGDKSFNMMFVNDILSDAGASGSGRLLNDMSLMDGLLGVTSGGQQQASDASSGEDFDDETSSSSGSDVDVESVPEDVNMFLNINPKD